MCVIFIRTFVITFRSISIFIGKIILDSVLPPTLPAEYLGVFSKFTHFCLQIPLYSYISNYCLNLLRNVFALFIKNISFEFYFTFFQSCWNLREKNFHSFSFKGCYKKLFSTWKKDKNKKALAMTNHHTHTHTHTQIQQMIIIKQAIYWPKDLSVVAVIRGNVTCWVSEIWDAGAGVGEGMNIAWGWMVIASWKEQGSWGSVFRLQQDCRK